VKSNILIAVEWLWSHRGKNMYWRPHVLTPENTGDPSAPKLTTVEAASVFKLLMEKGLMFTGVDDKGAPAFWLHEAKVQEWNAFLENLKKQENSTTPLHSPGCDQGSPDNDSGQDRNNEASGKGVFGNTDRLGVYELLGGVVFFAMGSGFSEIEFHKCAIVCYYLSVQSGLAAGFQYLRRTYLHAVKCLWISSVLTVALFGFEFWRAQPKPYPVLSLSMSTDDAPDDWVQLTNEFLFRKDFGPPWKYQGVLMVPLQLGKSNIALEILVRNKTDSPAKAEDLQMVITLPKNLSCIPGTGWGQVKIESPGYFSGTENKTKAEQSWEYSFPPLLPGLGQGTSPFQILQATTSRQIYFSILIRANDCPPQQLTFDLMPIILPSNFPPHKVFFMEGKVISSNGLSFSEKEILNNLHK
jgi:hypothetical protein